MSMEQVWFKCLNSLPQPPAILQKTPRVPTGRAVKRLTDHAQLLERGDLPFGKDERYSLGLSRYNGKHSNVPVGKFLENAICIHRIVLWGMSYLYRASEKISSQTLL
jgi:hypothetical protein